MYATLIVPITNTYHFTRRSDSDCHPILDVSLTNSVSYDLFSGQEVVAALITNSGNTFAQFIGERKFTVNSPGFLLRSVKRRITTEDNQAYAEILIKRPFLGKDRYQIQFSNEEENYTFQYTNIKPSADNEFLDFKAGLVKDGQTFCAIKNFHPRKRFYDPRRNYLKGVIELYDGTEKERVFVLIQVLQLYFELDMLF